MFRLQIRAPEYGILEFVFMLFEQFYRLGISYRCKIAFYNTLQSLDKSFIHKVVEKSHFIGTFFKHVFYNVFDHIASEIHIVLQIRKRDFRLNHPKFGSVAVGITLFRSESRSESIDVTKRKRKTLCVKLTADGQTGGFAEKVF